MSEPARKTHFIRITLCCIAGGALGFIVMGTLNERETIGYGNLGDQFLKLILATLIGCLLGGHIASALSKLSDES